MGYYIRLTIAVLSSLFLAGATAVSNSSTTTTSCKCVSCLPPSDKQAHTPSVLANLFCQGAFGPLLAFSNDVGGTWRDPGWEAAAF